MVKELPLYKEWVRAEAKKINSDGCSVVFEINNFCCYVHDLEYYYGRRAAHAFHVGWDNADKITRIDADLEFRKCNQEHSRFRISSPLAAWRWAGVRVLGWNAWRKHRKLRP